MACRRIQLLLSSMVWNVRQRIWFLKKSNVSSCWKMPLPRFFMGHVLWMAYFGWLPAEERPTAAFITQPPKQVWYRWRVLLIFWILISMLICTMKRVQMTDWLLTIIRNNWKDIKTPKEPMTYCIRTLICTISYWTKMPTIGKYRSIWREVLTECVMPWLLDM